MKGPVTSVLQSAAVATGNGVEVAIAGYASVGLQVTITGTATVTFEGSADKGTTWASVLATKVGTTTTGATATATGAYQANVAGLTHFRGRISALTPVASVTVTATFIEPGGSSGGGGGAAGAVSIADGSDVAEGATTDAAVTTNTTGTISGKLRGLVAIWAGLKKAIGTAAGATDDGIPGLQIRDDALSALSDPEGDYVPERCDSTGSKWVTLSAAAEVIGTTAHDAADANAPVKIGAKAIASVVGATPVTAADRTDLYAGLDGVLITRPHCNLEDSLSAVLANTDGASTAFSAPMGATASQRIYITQAIVANVHASTNCTVDIRDGTAGSVLATLPAPAAGGCSIQFSPPLRLTANTAAAMDVSAAVTTVTMTLIGFKSKI